MTKAQQTAQQAQKQDPDKPWLNPTLKPFVSFSNVSKQFGDFTAVDSINLNIYQGEMFALVGGSGCGKTTLLRMLAGFLDPTAGKVMIDGVDMNGVPPYERPVNMMFQSYALFPHMTVEKNIAYAIKLDKMEKEERKRRIDEALEMVQMSKFAHRKPHQLSGGQRQRVALARALIKRPKVLLLDEPLSALDKKLREATQFELMAIQHKIGITFIFVTHDQEEAMALSSRIAVLDKGQVIQVGTPSEIYEFPNSRFVAEFVGSTNMFEGTVVEDTPNQVVIDSPAANGLINVDDVGRYQIGQTVWVNVRPEKIKLSKKRPVKHEGLNVLEGTVSELGYRGNHVIYRVQAKSGKIIMVFAQSQARTEELDITWDDQVFVSWEANGCIIVNS
ncbi:MAG: ABC transporter ATP-binding protein [Alphaproteobacteria bacterium]|nr:ABC transporter ATP-binding protein [Alphaproteobacteria bacterium]